MSAIAPSGGKLRQLDAPTQPDQQVTAADAADPTVLSRFLMVILRDIAKLKRRWAPNFIDFRDVVVDGTGTTKYRFPHGFNSTVNYWSLKWVGGVGPSLAFDSSSDANTLVLVSNFAGTVSIRIEAAG